MFGFHRKKEERIPFDPEHEQVVIRKSICTGEQAGGIQDKTSKKIKEVMLIRNDADLEAFARMTGTKPEDIKTIY